MRRRNVPCLLELVMTREGILKAINSKSEMLKRQKALVEGTEAEIQMFRDALARFDKEQGELALPAAKK